MTKGKTGWPGSLSDPHLCVSLALRFSKASLIPAFKVSSREQIFIVVCLALYHLSYSPNPTLAHPLKEKNSLFMENAIRGFI